MFLYNNNLSIQKVINANDYMELTNFLIEYIENIEKLLLIFSPLYWKK